MSPSVNFTDELVGIPNRLRVTNVYARFTTEDTDLVSGYDPDFKA
jgi:hypothetical protein